MRSRTDRRFSATDGTPDPGLSGRESIPFEPSDQPDDIPTGRFDPAQGIDPPRRIDPALVDELGWCLIAVQNRFQQIRATWARELDVSVPQFLILVAVRELDRDVGVSVSDVSARLLVDASFVTTQSKALEKKALLRRLPSKTDARVVLMSLTDKARKQFASLASHQEHCAALIFADWNEDALPGLNETLRSLSQRLARTAVIITADI